MKKPNKSASDSGNLRKRAEEVLKNMKSENESDLSETKTIRLVHELLVHQIELELQNEELQMAKEKAELASQKYYELYDFAPSAYFTLSAEGKILELNHSGSQMLAKLGVVLKSSSFEFFVSEDTKPIFNHFFLNIFINQTLETCEVTLSLNDNSQLYVYLNGVVSENGKQCIVNVFDISERKLAEKALRESEERNRTLLLKTAMDGYYCADMQGRILEVNEMYCQMSGYSEQELLGMHLFDLDAVEVVEDINTRIGNIILQGIGRFETQNRRKDGRIFDVEVSIQYQPVEDGQLVAFLHDITERKQAEKALFESNEQFQLLFENSSDAIFFTNPDGTISSVNPEAERMLGRSKEEIIALRRNSISDEKDIRLIPALEERKRTGRFKGELNYLRSDGTSFPVEMTSTIFKDSNGIERSSIIARDITERKQAEEKLRKNNSTLTLAMEAANMAWWEMNIATGAISFEKRKAEMLGYPPENFVHYTDFMKLVHPEDAERAMEAMRRHIYGSAGKYEVEYRILSISGEYKWFYDIGSVTERDENGKAILVTGLVINITERKQSEQIIKESAERHLAIIQTAMDGYWLLNKQGLLLEVNETYCRMSGYSKQELLSMHVADLEHFEKADVIQVRIQNILEHGESRFEACHRRKDGSIFDIEASVQIQPGGDEQLVVFMHDITVRKQSEKALRESEESVRFKLQSILSPEGSIADLELDDIIDAPSIQKLMDNFYELAQIPIAIIDISGKVIVGSGWQDICTKFHRVHPQACKNCIESDIHLTQSIPDGEFKLYKCKNNMWDMATPLIIGGEHKGNLFMGQFFFDSEPIDYELFRKQAHQYGFAEQQYLDALDKAPRLSIQKLDHAKAFFLNLSSSISQLSYGNIKLARAVTQQKIVEEELREKDELLIKAQEIAHFGSWSLDLIKNQLTWSDEIYHIFGLQPKELSATYEGFLEAIHPEDRDAVNSAYNNSIIEGKDSYEIEHRIVRRHSGELRYVYEKCEHIRDVSGKIVSSVGMIHDITERKQSEEALIENERLLRESQAIANIGSYSVDLQHKNWKGSPEINEIFGIDENYPKTLDSWVRSIHPDFREELTNDLFQVKNETKLFEHEYKIIRINDGEHRWVHGLGEFEYDSQSIPFRLIGTIQDITGRKIKEEALQKLNKILAALSKSSQAMAQSLEEADYLKQVCEIVVEHTDFAMVWIGFAEDDDAKTIRPMASAGFKVDYLETIKLSWDDSKLGCGPTGVAIRTGKMSMCNNMLTDPDFEPWREEALKRDYASSIVFPLKTGDKTFGAISIYSKEPESFLDAEIKLLSKLANDLAHGISTIRLRAAHQLAEKALSKSHTELEELVKERTSELLITNDLLKKEIDIRYQQEQALKLAEEKYRTVADFAANWECWIDPNEGMIYCSPSSERITGYPADEFTQNSHLIFDIIHPDDLQRFQDLMTNEASARACDHEIQYRIIRKDGLLRWIGLFCKPVFDESGNFKGVRGSNKDITARKNMEGLLKTSNQKYRLLSENITDGIFICRDGCFEYVNNAMDHIFGYQEREFKEMKLLQLVMPDYLEELEFINHLKAPFNQVRNVEIECLKKDQSTVFVEFLFNYVAKERVIYGVVHDITGKKQLQKDIVKAIIQTEENERAYFSKELHDGLGPLLSTIKLYLQSSERSKSNKSREEIIHKAEEILEDALTTVKEISNKLSPHLLTNYGLTSAIQNFVDKLRKTSVIGITFQSNASKRVYMEIEAAIYRATIECINNTIKHAAAKNVTIVLNDTGSQLQLQYSDDGKGFDLEEALAAKKGLGLFNLQNRIQTIGGKITMFSKPGKGVDYRIVVNI